MDSKSHDEAEAIKAVDLNREQKRKKKPTDPDFTKATWSRQTRSELKRKRKLGRR